MYLVGTWKVSQDASLRWSKTPRCDSMPFGGPFSVPADIRFWKTFLAFCSDGGRHDLVVQVGEVSRLKPSECLGASGRERVGGTSTSRPSRPLPSSALVDPLRRNPGKRPSQTRLAVLNLAVNKTEPGGCAFISAQVATPQKPGRCLLQFFLVDFIKTLVTHQWSCSFAHLGGPYKEGKRTVWPASRDSIGVDQTM